MNRFTIDRSPDVPTPARRPFASALRAHPARSVVALTRRDASIAHRLIEQRLDLAHPTQEDS